MRFSRVTIIGAIFALVASLATSSGAANAAQENAHTSNKAGPIIIGADLPITGVQNGFGAYADWAYKNAVNVVNAQGGILIGKTRHQVKLIILDDQSDPNIAASNMTTLITHDNAVALLGSMSPQLVNPGDVVAERAGIPIVGAANPEQVFTSVEKWKWAWDIFFSLTADAKITFQTLTGEHVATNKKIAILYVNDAGGQGQDATWQQDAKQNGYKVVLNTSFPATLTNFSSMVEAAKTSGAQILMTVAETPQSISIRREMVTGGYTPKVLVMEQGGEPYIFAQQAGSLANGVLVAGYWAPSFPYPGAAALAAKYTKQTGNPWSQHLADETAAAQVLLGAISKAGSTSPSAINAAIAKTNLTDQAGHIKFGSNHVSVLPVVETQWQNGKVKVVYPLSRANAKMIKVLP
jgi:branched-chain amino acid transport system substrate-binding protein